MSHISKPVDWDVFNIPSIQPVQYYSILKKKKEFSELVKEYDAQAYKHGYLHYCGIVPKNITSSFSNRYEIVIVFFDEIPNTSFIGFRVKASKETFTYESNSLLLFLKKSKKAVFYLMNNNCIHVQCGTNAWELFYLLYDDFLRKCVLTILGTQFFYHFVYSYCIQREIQLFEILFKGSKIIRIGKNSVYYKMHRKRKISVTDLIYMTLNMPRSKRYIISCFGSKQSPLHSDSKDGGFYTSVGSKIKMSKLELKKFKRPFHNILLNHQNENSVIFKEMPAVLSFYSNSSLKRKFAEVDYIEPEPSISKCFKSHESHSLKIHENEWKQYQVLNPYTVKCYSGISCINHLVPKLLRNEKSSGLMSSDCNVFMLPLINEGNSKTNVQTHKEFSRERDLISFTATDINTKKIITEKKQMSSVKFKTFYDCEASIDSITPNINSFHKDASTFSPTGTIKTTNQEYLNISKDLSFTTVTGRVINVSDTAILSAHKLIQDVISEENYETLNKRVTYDPNKMYRKISNFETIYPNTKQKLGSECNFFIKNSLNKPPSHGINIFKENESSFQNFETVLSPKANENKLDSFDIEKENKDLQFATATGKTIEVSNIAMQAAHKLIHSVFDKKNIPTSSKGIKLDKSITYKNTDAFFEEIGSSKESINETIDVDMDNTVVEKFFEDTLFDEKELESALEWNIDNNSNLALVSNSGKNFPPRKLRKSLGGRRSMKYSSKL